MSKALLSSPSWLLVVLLGASPALWAHDGRQHAAEPAAAATTANPPGRANPFPNVPLITHEGKVVRFYDDLIKGKAVVVNLMFTHCDDACPLETARLAQVQRLLGERVGREIDFYSLSIDPARDTPAVLKAYAERFQAAPGWLFLTGKESDIQSVAKRLGLTSRTDDADRDGHLPSLMVGVEPSGQWMRLAALDNPRFLASKIESFLIGWNKRPVEAASGYATARPIEGLSAGAYLFRTRCASCHTVGQGEALGPDLAGVTQRRDPVWLSRFIKAPEQLRAERDPLAMALFEKYKAVRMPNLRLGDGDVQVLIDYLRARSATAEDSPRHDSVIGPAAFR